MADTTDEIDASGQAIADFIGALGESVALGQTALDRNTADIAVRLSQTMVNLPSVIQEVFDDNGNPTAANIVNNQVPMSTIILPVAYQFSRVYYQADLKLSEMDKKNGVRLVKNAAKLKGDAKVDLGSTLLSGGMPGVNIGASGSISTSESRNTTTSSIDSSVATLHFEATLEPRREVQVPTPIRLRTAPRVMVAVTNFALVPMVPSAAGPPAVAFVPEQRTALISVRIFRVSGAEITAAVAANVTFGTDAPDLNIAVALPAAAGAPIALTVQRTQSAEIDPLPTRTPTVIRATLGALTEQISINI